MTAKVVDGLCIRLVRKPDHPSPDDFIDVVILSFWDEDCYYDIELDFKNNVLAESFIEKFDKTDAELYKNELK